LAEQSVSFPAEIVPDADSIFMRAHKNFFRGGTLGQGVFKAHDGGMSVDWSKYSSAQQTQLRGRKPKENAVIEMNVGEVRAIPTLEVSHTPKQDNQAHCDVPLPEFDEDLTEVRFKLRGIAKIVIPVAQ